MSHTGYDEADEIVAHKSFVEREVLHRVLAVSTLAIVL